MRPPLPLSSSFFKATRLSLMFALVVLIHICAKAQRSKAIINQYTPLIENNGRNFTATRTNGSAVASWSDWDNTIDGIVTNKANWGALVTLGSLTSPTLKVRDENASGTEEYPAGSYAGFVIDNFGVADLQNLVTVTTYLDGAKRDERTVDGTLLSISLLSGGVSRVGLITTQSFNEIEVKFSVIGALSARGVYYAEVLVPGASATPACNVNTPLVQGAYPAVVNTGTRGIADVTLLGNVFSNISNVVDAGSTSPAAITVPVAVGAEAYLSVLLAGPANAPNLPAGYFAGFEVSNSTLLNLDLLKNTSIVTYRDGVRQDSIFGTNLLVGAPLLSSTGKFTIGIVTSQDFDEVRYNMTNVLGVSLGTTNVYNAVVKRFCQRATDFTCNTPTTLNSVVDPVYINMSATGVDGTLAVGNNLAELDKIIDADPNSGATMNLTLGALGRGRVAVKNAVSTYDIGTYVGFDVQTAALLEASVLGSATIKLFNGITQVQSSTGNGLLIGAKSSILGNDTRQTIGVVASAVFDQVQIEFTQPVGANLGAIKIYNVKIQKNCAAEVVCNTTNIIKTPEKGAVIQGVRSGITGAVCAGCGITDIEKVVDNDASVNDFANIRIAAGVGATGSISVVTPATTYPGGTIAGFVIRNRNNALLYADLLSSIRITTWNKGVEQESRTAAQLLNLQVIIPILGTTSGVYNLGFATSLPYDEIQISTTTVVGALKDMDVFYATVDTRYVPAGTPGLGCSLLFTLPDINYGVVNIPLTGDISTNDKKPASAVYSGSVAANGADQAANPPGAVFTLNANGTYTHQANQPGYYTYETTLFDPVSGITKKENLTIIVAIPPDVNLNPPVVNTDAALTKINTPIDYPVTANDIPSTPGATLGQPTISVQPKYGTATVTGSGNILYTPITGFVGRDTLTYNVCEQPGGTKCGSAYLIVEVDPPNLGLVVAADDFDHTSGETITGNLVANDTDSEGEAIAVEQQNITNSTGTLTIAPTGDYSYTPAPGYSGTAQFPYRAARSSNAQLNSMGTLYIDANQVESTDLSVSISVGPSIVNGSSTMNAVVSVTTVNENASAGDLYILIPVSTRFVLDPFNVSLTSLDGFTVQNADWTYLGSNGISHRFKLGGTNNKLSITGSTTSRFGLTMIFNSSGLTGEESVTATIFQGSGGDTNDLNNSDSDIIVYSP